MIRFLLRIKNNFVKLVRIKDLITAGVITSSLARIIEGSIFTFYTGIITYVLVGLNSGVWDNPLVAGSVLVAGMLKTILGGILKALRDNESASIEE